MGIHSPCPVEKKENLSCKYLNMSEANDPKKQGMVCHTVPTLNQQVKSNIACDTAKSSEYPKKDQNHPGDALSSECYKILGIPCNNYSENEKIDQDEINSLIYQTFFGIKE